MNLPRFRHSETVETRPTALGRSSRTGTLNSTPQLSLASARAGGRSSASALQRSATSTMPGTALKTLSTWHVFQPEEKVIVMRSVKSSVIGTKAVAARGAVVIVIFVQALGLEVASAQELSQPRIEEETAKQEKIYRSRGA